MEADVTASTLPATLDFQVPVGSTVATRVLQTRRDGDDVVVVVEVSQEEWELIDLVMYFNLLWDRRNPGTVSGTGAVQIVMQLDPSLADRIEGDDVITALSALPLDDQLRSTTSWYGLEVTEAVELPPELADKGEVRQGFTTTWADELATR